MIGDLVLLHDGRELVQIAEHHEPHAAERLAGPPAIDTQRLIDGPHQIGPHHRHLVDDEQLELAHQRAIAAAADVVWPDEPRWQTEERVDGLATDIDRGEPRRRHDHHGLGHEIPERPEQRRLARAGSAGNEDVALARAQVVDRCFVLGCRLQALRPIDRRRSSDRRSGGACRADFGRSAIVCQVSPHRCRASLAIGHTSSEVKGGSAKSL